jgi:hypothetical protein
MLRRAKRNGRKPNAMVKAKLSTEYVDIVQVDYLKIALDISLRKLGQQAKSSAERAFYDKSAFQFFRRYLPPLRKYWLPTDSSMTAKLKAIGIMGEEFAMTSDQIAIEQCAALCGLDSNDSRTDLTRSFRLSIV